MPRFGGAALGGVERLGRYGQGLVQQLRFFRFARRLGFAGRVAFAGGVAFARRRQFDRVGHPKLNTGDCAAFGQDVRASRIVASAA